MGSFVPICMRAVTRPQKHKAAELRTTSHGERGSPRMETNLQCPNPLYTHNAGTTRRRTALVAISAGAVAVVAISGGARHGRVLPAPRLILQPARIVADGYRTAPPFMERCSPRPPSSPTPRGSGPTPTVPPPLSWKPPPAARPPSPSPATGTLP